MSKTMGSSPGASTATQAVFPPYRPFASHGHGVDPRTPKKLTLTEPPDMAPRIVPT